MSDYAWMFCIFTLVWLVVGLVLAFALTTRGRRRH